MQSDIIESRYLIYEDSRIYDIYKSRYLKLCYTNRYITAFINGKNKYVHILLANCFIPNPNMYTQVNHINGIKHDIRIVNLEWCTPSYNQKHAFAIGLKSEGNERRTKLISKKVYDLYTGKIFDSAKVASIYYNINYNTLIGMLSGHNKNNTSLNYVI